MAKNFKLYFLWFSLSIILIYILQVTIPGFTDMFKLSSKAMIMPWQFVTAVFLHGSVSHLVYNLFALLLFGFICERLIGSRKFLIAYLGGGILANLISWWWYPNALGASGAIMAIIGIVAAIRPMMMVWAFGVILPMFIVAIAWVVGSIMGVFGIGNTTTGYLAHLVGILFGLLYGIYLRVIYKYNKQSLNVYRSKLVIPDDMARRWEDLYMLDR